MGRQGSPLSRHLYLRIWLAVVANIILVTVLAGWGMRLVAEMSARDAAERLGEESLQAISVLDEQGRLVGTGEALRSTRKGVWRELKVDLQTGEKFYVQIPERRRAGPPHGRNASLPQPPFWMRAQFFFPAMLVLVALAVAAGAWPVVRRLTARLEALQKGVQRFGEGQLSTRVSVQGNDEVADLAQRFNSAAERIEDLVRSQKSLLANASHELRSPLARIRMSMELIGEGAPSSARAEILRNIAELDQLVDEILLTSRLDAREANVGTPEQVDMIGLAAEECARVNAELVVDTQGRAVFVHGVARLLRRALRNLLENARRYGGGSEITLTITCDAQHVWISVCDFGPGVPAPQRARIFEPFYRVPGASEREGGVGLGLALVHTIVARHGGTAHCQDRPDGQKGACFVLGLPLQAG